MVLFAVLAGVLVLACLGIGLWFALPALRSFRGPDFEPTYTDDEIVFQVQQKFTTSAGGGGA